MNNTQASAVNNSSSASSKSADALVATAANSTAAQTPAMPSKPVASPAVQKQFDSALALLKSNRVAEAQQELRLLTQTNPELPAPWINLGVIELKANRFDGAVNYFRKALAADSGSALAGNYLGMAYRNLGQFKEAEAAYKSAISANADFALAHFNLGVLYDLYLQQPDAALQEYERYQALQSAPDGKVAGWIKDLKSRLGSKAKTAEAGS